VLQSPRRARALVVAALVGAALVAACSASASPNPSASCNGADEQSGSGFYPDLERLLPARVGNRTLTNVRSGRYCSARTLGTLLRDGIHELQFAGGALPDPRYKDTGLALIVYRAAGMTLDQLADAQALGAGDTQGAAGVVARRATIAGRSGIRIDVTVQSGPEMLFFWPTSERGLFEAVTGIGATEAQVEAAVAAFGAPGPALGGGSPGPSSGTSSGTPP
jgi:hypothetical protein